MPTLKRDEIAANPTPLGAWMARSPGVRTGRWVARGLSRIVGRRVAEMEVSRWRRHPSRGGSTPTPEWRALIERWTRGAVRADAWTKRINAEAEEGPQG